VIDFSSLDLSGWLILLTSYPVLWMTSGILVVHIGSYIKGNEGNTVDQQYGRAGKVVGKCENFLVLTFVFAGEFTALAVIFAAEGVISLEYPDTHYPAYFLSGTLVNFSYSIAVAMLTVAAIRFGQDAISLIQSCV